MEGLELLPQECEGDYNFNNRILVTRGFLARFREKASTLAYAAREEILKKDGDCADYLQVFRYDGEKFYIISDFRNGETEKDFDLPYLYCTVLMPEEV